MNQIEIQNKTNPQKERKYTRVTKQPILLCKPRKWWLIGTKNRLTVSSFGAFGTACCCPSDKQFVDPFLLVFIEESCRTPIASQNDFRATYQWRAIYCSWRNDPVDDSGVVVAFLRHVGWSFIFVSVPGVEVRKDATEWHRSQNRALLQVNFFTTGPQFWNLVCAFLLWYAAEMSNTRFIVHCMFWWRSSTFASIVQTIPEERHFNGPFSAPGKAPVFWYESLIPAPTQ